MNVSLRFCTVETTELAFSIISLCSSCSRIFGIIYTDHDRVPETNSEMPVDVHQYRLHASFRDQ